MMTFLSQEVTTFLNADVAMPMPHSPGAALPFRVSLRCGLSAPEVKLAPHRPMLLHAVLASYYPRQVRARPRCCAGCGQHFMFRQILKVSFVHEVHIAALHASCLSCLEAPEQGRSVLHSFWE
jgi:hypothetical protein